MKNLFFAILASFAFCFPVFSQDGDTLNGHEVESVSNVDADAEAVSEQIGQVKTFTLISSDTAQVENLDGETFVLVGENIGSLVAELVGGYEQAKEKEPESVLGWFLALLPWLLGGGLTSVIAYATRAINGIKKIFAGVERDYKIVLGVAAGLAFGWGIVQGGNFATPEFWQNFVASWFQFGGMAFVLYFTILRRFFETPEGEAKQARKVEEAVALVRAVGGEVSLPSAA